MMPKPVRRTLTAYYFRQHLYTLVPRHLREDMEWMADAGTQHVAIAVLEQDLQAARSNIEWICREAGRVGMSVHAVPSRWGGLFAGAPKVPSLFAANNPETWMRRENGEHYRSMTWGPMASFFHPATVEYFRQSLEALLKNFPVTGIIWDEPKPIEIHADGTLKTPDFSEAARACGPAPGEDRMKWQLDGFADFVEELGRHAKSICPSLTISMFQYGHLTGYPVERCARIPSLDCFGCDGKPWSFADLEGRERKGELCKALLDQGPFFLDMARRNGKGGLLLIEDHNIPDWSYDIMDRRLPDVLALNPESLFYYYYPRNLSDPDRVMGILKRHLKTWRHGNRNA